MPRPPVRGAVIDWHTHMLAARHARDWFAAADHYGIDTFVTMTPLEEALALYRQYPRRLHFIAIPRWQEGGPFWLDEWMRRIEAFQEAARPQFELTETRAMPANNMMLLFRRLGAAR